MSTLVSLFLQSNFLQLRPVLRSRFPLFYTSASKDGTLPWTNSDITRADYYYELYLLLLNKKPSFSHKIPAAPAIYEKIYKSPRIAALVWACRPTTTLSVRSTSDSKGQREKIATDASFVPQLISSETQASHSSQLVEGHALIFAPNGIIESDKEYDTELCKRYRGSNAVMWPLSEPSPNIVVSEEASHLAIFVFYRVVEKKPRVIPVYDIVSRGYMKLGEGKGDTLTTFAGPLTSSYNVDLHSFRTIRNFEYAVDCVFHFDGTRSLASARRDDIAPATTPTQLFGEKEELALNLYMEKMYEKMESAGIDYPQSFVYRGLNSLVPITCMAYFSADESITEIHFANSIKRTCARRGLTEEVFCSKLLNGDDAAEKRQLFIEVANLGNTMNYRADLVWGKKVDVHESIRLTNSGDCEDSGEAAFRILRRLQGMRDVKSKGVRALCEFVQKTNMIAMLIHMRVNYKTSDSHTVAGGIVPLDGGKETTLKVNRKHQMYFMDATGAEQGNFCVVPSKEKEETEWREMMSKLISKHSVLDYYKEPCCSEKEDKVGDFYIGFLGGVAAGGLLERPSYYVFSSPGSNMKGVSKKGIDVCETVIGSNYELVDILAGFEKESWFAEAHRTMKEIATLAPPLPLPSDTCEFPKEYSEWLSKFKTVEKGGEKSRNKAFTVFVSLTESIEDLENAMRDLETLQTFASRVDVTGFSIFKDNVVIEINFW